MESLVGHIGPCGRSIEVIVEEVVEKVRSRLAQQKRPVVVAYRIHTFTRWRTGIQVGDTSTKSNDTRYTTFKAHNGRRQKRQKNRKVGRITGKY